jgi:broad specificity phosphatase PhoE
MAGERRLPGRGEARPIAGTGVNGTPGSGAVAGAGGAPGGGGVAGAGGAPGGGGVAGAGGAPADGAGATVASADRGPSAARSGDQAVRLVLWRHGQTQWNAERRFQGQTDIPLDNTGGQQAERAARLLAALRPDAIYSSDLARALSTAAPLARLTGLTVIPDKDLRERCGGLWEGLTDIEIRQRYPDEHSQWLPPGGETSAAVADRAVAAMDRIAGTLAPGSLAVVVSHGAALRLGAARLLGLPEDLWGVIGPLANCAWSVLGRRHGRWRLIEHNAGTLPEPVLSDDR